MRRLITYGRCVFLYCKLGAVRVEQAIRFRCIDEEAVRSLLIEAPHFERL